MVLLAHAQYLVIAEVAMPAVQKYNYNVVGGSMMGCSLVNLAVPSGMEAGSSCFSTRVTFGPVWDFIHSSPCVC